MTAPQTSTTRSSWITLGIVATFATLTVVSADLVLQRLLPYPPPRKEVEDAIRQYEASDPTILVLGSSHARTFDSVAALVRREQPDGERILAVPVELGKYTSYRWVLDHRLWPIADETRNGAKVRNSLKQVILVTEWWDSCDTDDGGPSLNLPARAWTWSDFLADATSHGVTPYNRNYVRNRWQRLWSGSLLVRDRGHERILPLLIDRLHPRSEAAREAALASQTATWQRMVEDGIDCISAPAQMEAFEAMMNEFAQRQLAVTILLYPRKPGTLTAQAKASTLPRFAELMRARADAHGARFIDMTTTSPLGDEHFADDFDHVTSEGNVLFSKWAVDSSLNWLVQPKHVNAVAGELPAKGAS